MPDFLPIVFSAAALVISAAAFFFQHLYYADEVVCLVTGTDVKPETTMLHVYCWAAISNSGTRAILLERASLEMRRKIAHGGSMTFRGNQATDGKLPAVVPKGEFKRLLFTVDVPRSVLSQYLAEGLPRGSAEFWLNLSFVTVAGEQLNFDRRVVVYTPEANGHRIEMPCAAPVKVGVKKIRVDWETV